jgi:hypothetical protein
MTEKLIELEPGFSPWKVGAVRHHLTDHPSLRLERLVALARRLGSETGIRYHDGGARPDTTFVTAPETLKPAVAPIDALERIEDSQVWLALHNVQRDPEYRELIDLILDDVAPEVARVDPGLCHRAGWIFVASPGAVTPYHMDHEHNFILQIAGKKTLHVWEALDREVVTERSLELFHAKLSRELVVWSEAIAPRARVFELEPGVGGYMPATSPHWVKNGDNVSITVSATYYTRSTLRRKLLHRANFELRRRGVEPRPVGASPALDAVKAVTAGGILAAKTLVRRLLGRGAPPRLARYSPG